MDNSFIFTIIIGSLALFGLQNSIGLAMQHRTNKHERKVTACNRVAKSPYAFIGKIPVAYGVPLFYVFILGQLLQGFQQGQLEMTWITAVIMAGIVITLYYAYLLFFVLRVWCRGCIKIYIVNIGMGLCLLGYYFY